MKSLHILISILQEMLTLMRRQTDALERISPQPIMIGEWIKVSADGMPPDLGHDAEVVISTSFGNSMPVKASEVDWSQTNPGAPLAYALVIKPN